MIKKLDASFMTMDMGASMPLSHGDDIIEYKNGVAYKGIFVYKTQQGAYNLIPQRSVSTDRVQKLFENLILIDDFYFRKGMASSVEVQPQVNLLVTGELTLTSMVENFVNGQRVKDLDNLTTLYHKAGKLIGPINFNGAWDIAYRNMVGSKNNFDSFDEVIRKASFYENASDYNTETSKVNLLCRAIRLLNTFKDAIKTGSERNPRIEDYNYILASEFLVTQSRVEYLLVGYGTRIEEMKKDSEKILQELRSEGLQKAVEEDRQNYEFLMSQLTKPKPIRKTPAKKTLVKNYRLNPATDKPVTRKK